MAHGLGAAGLVPLTNLEKRSTQCVLSGLEGKFCSHLAPPEAAGSQAARQEGPGPWANADSGVMGPLLP